MQSYDVSPVVVVTETLIRALSIFSRCTLTNLHFLHLFLRAGGFLFGIISALSSCSSYL